MGRIVEYNSPVGYAPQPTDMAASTAREAGTIENRLGRETGAAIGGAIARVGSQLGDAIDNYHTSQAIGHGAATYSQMFANLTDQWNKLAANTDPNDTSVVNSFREGTLEPALQKFQEAFEGQPQRAQEWALSQADRARQHFYQTTTADMGTRAAAAVKQNLDDITRNFANAAFNDPSTLSHAEQTIGSSIDALISSSPYMTADAAARFKTEEMPKMLREVARSTAYGIGMRNPDQLITDINAGKFDSYLDPAQKNAALRQAQEEKRSQQIDQEHQRALQDRVKRDAAEKAKDGYVTALLNGKSIKGYTVDPNLTAEGKENIRGFQQELIRQGRENVSNEPHPQAVRSLLNDLFDKAKTDPNNVSVQPIRDAFAKGLLNPREEAELEQRVGMVEKPLERQWNAQLRTLDSAYKSSAMGQASAITDPIGYAAKLNQMDRDFHEAIAEYQRSGKDVNALLDPKAGWLAKNAPMYLGTSSQRLAEGAAAVKAQAGGAVEFNGYRFPNQAALDKYKTALAGQKKGGE